MHGQPHIRFTMYHYYAAVCWLGKIHKRKQNALSVQSSFTHHTPNTQVDRRDISQPEYFTKTLSYGCPKFPVVLGVTEFHLQVATQAPRLNFRQATKASDHTRYIRLASLGSAKGSATEFGIHI